MTREPEASSRAQNAIFDLKTGERIVVRGGWVIEWAKEEDRVKAQANEKYKESKKKLFEFFL